MTTVAVRNEDQHFLFGNYIILRGLPGASKSTLRRKLSFDPLIH